ncbi:O-antigen ligase family protein [Flavobacterium capsici]|uniref:O-antigen ligase family protein n=2 Tax=Flavobacterium capsici TaxID=3075618 RepID=A0AA96EZE7_9FLAO|nr:O-antigen ligase family protein [Flavobacterium sp. PMTSA4]WNM21066.1 O-antigen ligase family protein [Flavobacterium sp. PMTSA4]
MVLTLPIVLFLLMTISYTWSIDRESTLNAIPKEITLLVIPLAFAFNKKLDSENQEKIVKYFAYSMILLGFYFLFRAFVRYSISHDIRNFFYHGDNDDKFGLIPKLLNAIHVSYFMAIAFFYYFSKTVKTRADYIISIILLGFIFLMSSKNIILIVILLILAYTFFFSKIAHKMRLRNLIVFGLIIALLFSYGRIKQRFEIEFQTNTKKSLSANVIEGIPLTVHNVSIKEAWQNEKFTQNDFFSGTVFRVYQFRIFLEFLKEEPIFWKGFGLNASYPKIKEKAIYYDLYMGEAGDGGYQNKNFHNQYVQNFAELGIFGFIILLLIVALNLKNALKSKDFVHFAFAILTISLFLTETLLWRQRGVVFFTIFYCLFNTSVYQKKIEKRL